MGRWREARWGLLRTHGEVARSPVGPVKNPLTLCIAWICAPSGLGAAPSLRRLPERRVVDVPPLLVGGPQARGPALPAMRSRASVCPQGLRLSRAPAIFGAPSLGCRLRRADRALRPPFQVRGLAPVGRTARPARGRATGGRRACGALRGRRAVASRPSPRARIQPG